MVGPSGLHHERSGECLNGSEWSDCWGVQRRSSGCCAVFWTAASSFLGVATRMWAAGAPLVVRFLAVIDPIRDPPPVTVAAERSTSGSGEVLVSNAEGVFY